MRRTSKAPAPGQLALLVVPVGPCRDCGREAWHRPQDAAGRLGDAFACMACHAGCGVCATPAVLRAGWDEQLTESGRDAARRKG